VVCGNKPEITHLVDSKRFCADEEIIALDKSEQIQPGELAERLKVSPFPILIDVRSPIEQQVSRIQGAISIPLEQLSERLGDFDKDQEIVVFCRTGRRSARALQLMRKAGFDHVRNMVGGINAWAEKVQPDLFQY
jgi:adenylyltransferase/sulfurtransferase